MGCPSSSSFIEAGAMAFAIKTEIPDMSNRAFAFTAQKTMYGGKHITAGDVLFVFASENEGGHGLFAQAIVRSTELLSKIAHMPRQTPRVSLSVDVLATTARALGRKELKSFTNWADGRPETELNFKLYRQATNKIVGVSDECAAFLESFF